MNCYCTGTNYAFISDEYRLYSIQDPGITQSEVHTFTVPRAIIPAWQGNVNLRYTNRGVGTATLHLEGNGGYAHKVILGGYGQQNITIKGVPEGLVRAWVSCPTGNCNVLAQTQV